MIENIEMEKLKTEKLNLGLSMVRLILLIIGSSIIFFMIQKPDSILNRKMTLEEINRERAKLLLQIIKEENPEIKILSINILKATYPELNNLLLPIEDEILKISIDKNIIQNKRDISDLEAKIHNLEILKGNLSNQVEKNIINNNIELLKIELENSIRHAESIEKLSTD